MTSSFPRLLAAWLGVRVTNRKKVRWQSIATHESGGLSPFRGHRSALNARVQFTSAGAFDKRDLRADLPVRIDPDVSARQNLLAMNQWSGSLTIRRRPRISTPCC